MGKIIIFIYLFIYSSGTDQVMYAAYSTVLQIKIHFYVVGYIHKNLSKNVDSFDLGSDLTGSQLLGRRGPNPRS